MTPPRSPPACGQSSPRVPGVELRAALDAIGLRVTPDERRALARALLAGRVQGVSGRRAGRRVWLDVAEETF